jgi:hypothetical protein
MRGVIDQPITVNFHTIHFNKTENPGNCSISAQRHPSYLYHILLACGKSGDKHMSDLME